MTWLPRGTRRTGTAVGVRDGGGAEAAPIRFRRQASSRGRATRVSVIRCVRACGPPGTRGQQVHMMTIFTQVHKIIHFTEGLRQRTPSPNPAFVSARCVRALRPGGHSIPSPRACPCPDHVCRLVFSCATTPFCTPPAAPLLVGRPLVLTCGFFFACLVFVHLFSLAPHAPRLPHSFFSSHSPPVKASTLPCFPHLLSPPHLPPPPLSPPTFTMVYVRDGQVTEGAAPRVPWPLSLLPGMGLLFGLWDGLTLFVRSLFSPSLALGRPDRPPASRRGWSGSS